MSVYYLSDGNPDGASATTSASEKFSLYGETPVVQASAIASPGSSLASVKTQLISVLTALRNLGVIAT